MKKLFIVIILVITQLALINTVFSVGETSEKSEVKKEVSIDEIIAKTYKEEYTLYDNEDLINITDFKTSYIIDGDKLKIKDLNTLIDDDFSKVVFEIMKYKYPSKVVDGVEDKSLFVTYDDYLNVSLNGNRDMQIRVKCDVTMNKISNCDKENAFKFNKIPLDPNKPTVVFTFDDGPNMYTPGVVKLLQEYKATATFFMLGLQMNYFPQYVADVIASGNEVGNHTFGHKNLVTLSLGGAQSELANANDIYKKLTKENMVYARPPYGSINSNILNNTDYYYFNWSVDPRDWQVRNSQVVANNVLSVVKDGDIVLLHDIHKTTTGALEIVLPELYNRGFQVVSISDYIKLRGYQLEKSKLYKNFR